VNAASEGLRTIVLERAGAVGGQASASSRIENYLGFADGLTGAELAEQARAAGRAVRRAARHGLAGDRPSQPTDDGHQAMCQSGHVYVCKTALVTSGVTYRTLDVPGRTELLGRGVDYGASPAQAQASTARASSSSAARTAQGRRRCTSRSTTTSRS
jgi:thioredoxin reductase (NADPH)